MSDIAHEESPEWIGWPVRLVGSFTENKHSATRTRAWCMYYTRVTQPGAMESYIDVVQSYWIEAPSKRAPEMITGP